MIILEWNRRKDDHGNGNGKHWKDYWIESNRWVWIWKAIKTLNGSYDRQITIFVAKYQQ